MVDVVRTKLVTVDVPKDKRKRLGPTAGKLKPASISKGIRDDSSARVLATSATGLLDLVFRDSMIIKNNQTFNIIYTTYFLSVGRKALPSLALTSSSL